MNATLYISALDQSTRYRRLIQRAADVMRRCDPEYVASHSVQSTTDDEWDQLLEALEDAT